MRRLPLHTLCVLSLTVSLYCRADAATCAVNQTTFEGWEAQEIVNPWLKLTFVPKLGGRLMQVAFNGHPYLFVNPRYLGKYISPEEANGRWINYGGDKIWPMPEGNSDDHHWVLASTAIDDLPYAFAVLSQGKRCTVRLTGEHDSITGLQYIRTITVSADSPAIEFHAVMRNATTHPIDWSVQSVTQYDLSDPKKPSDFNHDFWAFTPTNPASSYPDGFHVRSGLADDPSFSVADALFRLRWMYFDNEVWLDSHAGWLAVVDQTSKYGMIERFHYYPSGNYPGKATVIFYKSGPSVHFDKQGQASIRPATQASTPYYMEAEINSPIVRLRPGETYALDTTWNPIRIDSAPQRVTNFGVISQKLVAARHGQSVVLTGTISSFANGQLVASFLDHRGIQIGRRQSIQQLNPEEINAIDISLTAPAGARSLVVKFVDGQGVDRGILNQLVLLEESTHRLP